MKCLKSYKNEEKKKAYIKRCKKCSLRWYAKTAIYPRRRYTPDDDVLVLKQELSDTELSNLIGHSVESIQVRRSRLKKTSYIEGGI